MQSSTTVGRAQDDLWSYCGYSGSYEGERQDDGNQTQAKEVPGTARDTANQAIYASGLAGDTYTQGPPSAEWLAEAEQWHRRTRILDAHYVRIGHRAAELRRAKGYRAAWQPDPCIKVIQNGLDIRIPPATNDKKRPKPAAERPLRGRNATKK